MSNEILLRLLGQLGKKVPELTEKQWDTIFEFLEYFTIVKNNNIDEFLSFDWHQVKEILTLLEKVK